MNDSRNNDKSKTPQSNAPTGKDSVQQGKDASSANASGNPSQQAAGKDANKGTESPTKS